MPATPACSADSPHRRTSVARGLDPAQSILQSHDEAARCRLHPRSVAVREGRAIRRFRPGGSRSHAMWGLPRQRCEGDIARRNDHSRQYLQLRPGGYSRWPALDNHDGHRGQRPRLGYPGVRAVDPACIRRASPGRREFPGPLVGDRRDGIRLGHQFRAPGRRHSLPPGTRTTPAARLGGCRCSPIGALPSTTRSLARSTWAAARRSTISSVQARRRRSATAR